MGLGSFLKKKKANNVLLNGQVLEWSVEIPTLLLASCMALGKLP